MNESMTIERKTRGARSLKRVVRHGRGAYVAGCRCNICIEANREYQRHYSRARFQAGTADTHGKKIVPNGPDERPGANTQKL
jgi:hypothetical protein